MLRTQSLSLQAAIQRLINAANQFDKRTSLKPHEQSRIKEALELLATGVVPETFGRRAKKSYLDFLTQVSNESGINMAALCAVGLGKSTIGYLAEPVRLDLPQKIVESMGVLDKEKFNKLIDELRGRCVQAAQDTVDRVPQIQLPPSQGTVEDQASEEQPTDFVDHTPQIQLPPSHGTVEDQASEEQQTDSVVLDLTGGDLIKYLRDQLAEDAALKMTCPLNGIPRPFIHAESQTGLKMKLEFDLKSSEALIRKVLATREPPHRWPPK